MQPSKYALVAVVTVCAGSFANADPGGIYVEGVAGTFSDDFYLFDEYEYSTVGVRAGYEFNSYFAVEGEYLFGTNTHETAYAYPRFTDLETVTSKYAVKLDAVYGVYGKASLPIGERLTMHMRAGYAERKLDVSSFTVWPDADAPISRSDVNNEDFLSFGVGGSFDLSDKIYARADLTSYGLAHPVSDIFSATASVGVRF